MSIKSKIKEFFTSYKGLLAMIILFELAIVIFLSTFSKPVVEVFGKPLLPIDLANSERGRVARIIMLYHALAVPFIAAITYFILDWYEIRGNLEQQIKWGITIGSIVTGISGISFAYVLTDWTSHGIYLFGLSVSFYAGVLLIFAIWPRKNFPSKSEDRGAIFKGLNWEYFNMGLTTFSILFSSALGAIAGANFGQGFDAVLAEDMVRREHNVYERMVVSHLHIMIALTAAAILLLTLRFTNMKGKLFRISQILYTPGVIIMSIGAWLVVPDFELAHMVINVGAGFLLMVSAIVAIYGIKQIAITKLGKEYDDANLGKKLLASLKDPAMFALYFQLLWVNVTSTFPGVYVAFNLDAYRSDLYSVVERDFNVGHWHVLATLCAMMMILLAVDYYDIRGKIRDLIGWLILLGSIFGFGFATLYMLRDPASEGYTLFLLIDFGVFLMFLAVGIFAVHYLVKHFSDGKDNLEVAKEE